ncbi:MAG: hypothetical protein D3904_03640 [Candidatus Electrothrix sp. EH2]|nr:hypothetical protein [Candidatus Electrothrix sp. EH2]
MWVKEYFYDLDWYCVYNLIEFIFREYEIILNNTSPFNHFFFKKNDLKKKNFTLNLNSILEKEMSGYRFISGYIVPITDKNEISEIKSAIEHSKKIGFSGVTEHISTALALLGKKPQPDYRNAIKEAISSVESMVKKISNCNSNGLKGALNDISQKTNIHNSLRTGFLKLYGYSSDENGIRHAILESSDINFAEAKYMIVSSSAFVNYLIEKGNQAGLLTQANK